MSATTMQVRSPRNAPETIIDKTPKDPFLSPLQQFIKLNCEQCSNYEGLCRLNDSRGLTPMGLCIQLYCNQAPDAKLQNFLTAIRGTQGKIQEISEKTLAEATEETLEQKLGESIEGD